MLQTASEHLGVKVWVNADGTPGMQRLTTTSAPQRISSVISSRNLIKRIDENAGDDPTTNGKYFSKRVLAFEESKKRWVILYQTKQLRLMNKGSKYVKIWGNVPNFKNPQHLKEIVHILEMSEPIHKRGRLILESLCYTKRRTAKIGRFLVVPKRDDKKLFDTEFAGKNNQYPLLRQSSENGRKPTDFRVTLRPIDSPNIDMIFIVHPKTLFLQLPETIDKQTYKQL